MRRTEEAPSKLTPAEAFGLKFTSILLFVTNINLFLLIPQRGGALPHFQKTKQVLTDWSLKNRDQLVNTHLGRVDTLELKEKLTKNVKEMIAWSPTGKVTLPVERLNTQVGVLQGIIVNQFSAITGASDYGNCSYDD